MARDYFRVPVAALAIVTMTASTLSMAQAAGGIAFDSVTKVAMGGETAAEPGTFAADFASASTVSAAGSGKRGFMGLGSLVNAASGAMAMVKNGTAQRHYIAGAKQRVDTLATGEAQIVDCRARTLTTLDLNKKTYTVVSLDQPVPTETPSKKRDRGEPTPKMTDDGTKMSLVMTSKALGSRTIEGLPAAGYDVHVKATTTKPTGETANFESDMTSYFSAYADPQDGCPEAASRLAARGNPGEPAEMGEMMLAMRAMRTPGGDPRFSVKSTGTPLPTGKLALWQHTTMGEGGGFGVLLERGNVRSIAENDPIFSVPADFTKKP